MTTTTIENEIRRGIARCTQPDGILYVGVKRLRGFEQSYFSDDGPGLGDFHTVVARSPFREEVEQAFELAAACRAIGENITRVKLGKESLVFGHHHLDLVVVMVVVTGHPVVKSVARSLRRYFAKVPEAGKTSAVERLQGATFDEGAPVGPTLRERHPLPVQEAAAPVPVPQADTRKLAPVDAVRAPQSGDLHRFEGEFGDGSETNTTETPIRGGGVSYF